MGKIINVVDKNNGLVASISNKNIILHNDYKVIETKEEEACFSCEKGEISIVKPEVST